MTTTWPALPYETWSATCNTLHAHTQLLGKLAIALAPPEPQLQHAALRLSARGWETQPLPTPDGSGAIVVALDLHRHEAVIEHSDGRSTQVSLAPDRAVADVTSAVMGSISSLIGGIHIDMRPQEVPWTVHLDEDYEHATYDPAQVATYFEAATQAALVLGALRAPYRGRSSPVNAWWGTFDLAVSLYSGRPADPPSDDFITRNAGTAQLIEIGWWPGDARYPQAAFYGFAAPPAEGLESAPLTPPAANWDDEMKEYLLNWEDVRTSSDPRRAALDFGLSVVRHACTVCDWDVALAASVEGVPPPVT